MVSGLNATKAISENLLETILFDIFSKMAEYLASIFGTEKDKYVLMIQLINYSTHKVFIPAMPS